MVTYDSDQFANWNSIPQVLVDPTQHGGRVRVAYFSYTVPTGNIAISSIVQLTKLPKGARILGGRVMTEAMSSAGADASIQIGIVGTAAKYLGTTSVDAIAEADFANTLALNFGEVLTVETTIIATVITEAWVAAKSLAGWVRYALD